MQHPLTGLLFSYIVATLTKSQKERSNPNPTSRGGVKQIRSDAQIFCISEPPERVFFNQNG